jgi:lipoprotein
MKKFILLSILAATMFGCTHVGYEYRQKIGNKILGFHPQFNTAGKLVRSADGAILYYHVKDVEVESDGRIWICKDGQTMLRKLEILEESD